MLKHGVSPTAKKGDKERAIADYRKALALNPSHESSRTGLKLLGATP